MTDRTSFNFTRVSMLIKMDLRLYKWPIIYSTIAVFALLIFISIISVKNTSDYDLHPFLGFPITLYGGVIFITSILFNDLHDPKKNVLTLSLPATQLEKVFSRFIISSVGYFVYALIFYSIFMLTAQLLNSILFLEPHPRDLIILPSPVKTIFYYLNIHALFFLGAIYFQKQTALKTSLSAALLVGFYYLTILIFSSPLSDIVPLEDIFRWQLKTTVDIVPFVLGALIPIFWITAYFRIQEKEV